MGVYDKDPPVQSERSTGPLASRTADALGMRAECEHTYTHMRSGSAVAPPSARVLTDTDIKPKPQVLLGPGPRYT